MTHKQFYFNWMAVLAALVMSAVAVSCSSPGPLPSQTTAQFASPGVTPAAFTETVTPFQPSPTSEALAARVNGIEISLSAYQAELARYQAATGGDLTAEDETRVLDDLIDQALLASAAEEQGFQLSEAELQSRVDRLTAEIGGEQALNEWMAANGYVETSFLADLRRSIAAAWMRDQIAATVPDQVEQVQAIQIFVQDAEDANAAMARLNAGANFAALAAEYDPITEGELGWFPRGYLIHPELEDAAFQLEPGTYSNIIQSGIGFHILYVVERDEQRPLDPEARLVLQEKAVKAWLMERRGRSTIEIMTP